MTEFIVPIFGALLFFVFALRVRRLFGRHRLSVPRFVFRITLLSSLAAFVVLLPSTSSPVRLLGVSLGFALAIGGVMTTRTERIGADSFYRPNPLFGLVIMALLLGRMVQRLFMAKDIPEIVDGSAPVTGLTFDPLSRLLILAVLSYFAAFYLGVLGRSRFEPVGGAPEALNRGDRTA